MLTGPMRRLIPLLAIAVSLATAAPASAAHHLTKRAARAGAVDFMSRFVWAFDRAQSGETFHVRPARYCSRVSHVTVTCPASVRLTTGAVITGDLRVHRTEQGFLGVLLPWDPAKIADTLGQPAGAEGVVDPVHVGVQ